VYFDKVDLPICHNAEGYYEPSASPCHCGAVLGEMAYKPRWKKIAHSLASVFEASAGTSAIRVTG